MSSRRFERDFLIFRDQVQVFGNEFRRDSMKIEPLTPANYRWQNFLWFCRREDKFYVRWRFFEGLEQRVERGRAQHMNLVDYVDFVARLCRSVTHVVPQ